jgi:hypothetical protein
VLAVALCWAAAVAIFALGPAQIGFVSDDYDLLATAGATPWLRPLEEHHYSPVLAALWKLSSQDAIGPKTWHGLALAAHCANILLWWLILVRRLSVARFLAWMAALLFALNAPGFEALAWACALGYVLVTTCILIAVYLALSQTSEVAKTSEVFSTKWALAILQLAAYAIWDWAAILAPIVLVSHVLFSDSSDRRARRLRVGYVMPADSAKSMMSFLCSSPFARADGEQRRGIILSLIHGARWFGPMFACWAAVPIVKRSLGIALGYSVSLDLARSAYFLLTAPLRTVYPWGEAALFKSPAGLAAAGLVVLFFVLGSRADRRIGWASALFLLCQGPYALLGAPESRYFYLGTGFLACAAVIGLARLPPKIMRSHALLLIALVGVHGLCSVGRALLWKEAYLEAVHVKSALEALAAGEPERELVVVNLPDRYGPPGLVWRPYVWRRGLSAFHARIVRVNTPGCPFTWAESGIPAMPPERIASEYRGRRICEVIYAEPNRWQAFAVVPWPRKGDSPPVECVRRIREPRS